jgi:hypothetical protein
MTIYDGHTRSSTWSTSTSAAGRRCPAAAATSSRCFGRTSASRGACSRRRCGAAERGGWSVAGAGRWSVDSHWSPFETDQPPRWLAVAGGDDGAGVVTASTITAPGGTDVEITAQTTVTELKLGIAKALGTPVAQQRLQLQLADGGRGVEGPGPRRLWEAGGWQGVRVRVVAGRFRGGGAFWSDGPFGSEEVQSTELYPAREDTARAPSTGAGAGGGADSTPQPVPLQAAGFLGHHHESSRGRAQAAGAYRVLGIVFFCVYISLFGRIAGICTPYTHWTLPRRAGAHPAPPPEAVDRAISDGRAPAGPSRASSPSRSAGCFLARSARTHSTSSCGERRQTGRQLRASALARYKCSLHNCTHHSLVTAARASPPAYAVVQAES